MKIRRVSRYGKRLQESVGRLMPQLDPSCPIPSEKYLKKVISDRDTFFLVAEDDRNEILGLLTITRYFIPSGTKYWIDDVIVDEMHRGEGIGKALMLHAILMAKREGAHSLDLTSRPFRTAANRLYSDLGFVRRETNVYRLILG